MSFDRWRNNDVFDGCVASKPNAIESKNDGNAKKRYHGRGISIGISRFFGFFVFHSEHLGIF